MGTHSSSSDTSSTMVRMARLMVDRGVISDSTGSTGAGAALGSGLGRLACSSTSRYLNLLQAAMKALGVFFSPIPMTYIPDSRSRTASRVKSLSLDTRQKPSTFPE